MINGKIIFNIICKSQRQFALSTILFKIVLLKCGIVWIILWFYQVICLAIDLLYGAITYLCL